ncbi:yipf6-like protein [Histomonas meleagridis]|uniref:yipf6-like protein n=1 Tax=Histomonas meleagridis TaxID=135588 RepID=UPI00355A0A28|nr:yipf6-like protein [Histomonas meleagridis]KAH0801545.1 yipf6-like protein [Histomonas meleagridis]
MEQEPLVYQNVDSELLTETVWETLMKDLNGIKSKTLVVLNPKASSENALRNWDLWGPLFICLILSTVLAITAPVGQTTLLFTGVFIILTIGGAIVSINFMLLGSTVSFFQAICAIGYCLFPIACGSLITAILSWTIIKVITVPLTLVWSIHSVSRFIASHISEDRKLLGLFPCGLLYTVISWITLIH